MKLFLTCIIFVLLSVSATFADPFGKLQGVTYGSGNKAVVVVLHGDVSKGGPADYHYAFAKSVAQRNKGVTAIALLRPGYSDRSGQKSGGSNNGRRDHYSKKNNDLVANALKTIKAQYKTKNLVVVGHSGGAAQTGSILGRFPGLVNKAVLVSCPCDINAWRNAKNASPWPKSQSPHRYVKKIPKSTSIVVVNGSKDGNTKPKQAKAYVNLVKSRGIRVSYLEINGAGHGFNRMTSKLANIVKQQIK
jgi:dienelactone hydrolase